jgi:hypothetical protein
MGARQANRQRDREVKELIPKLARLRAELAKTEQTLAGAREQSADIVAGLLNLVEEYVDSLAQVLNLEATRVLDDEANRHDGLLKHMVALSWRGVGTVEEAKAELEQEVARRSVGKTDLAFLLSSIDHSAFVMVDTMPDSLRELHGEAFIEAAVNRLTLENLAGDLVKDPSWATMSERWVRLGWRGTTTETFPAAFIRAAVERIAVIRDAAKTGSVPLDTVLDERLNRVMPERRRQMEEAFRLRLQREYELLPKGGAPGAAVAISPNGAADKHVSADAVEAIAGRVELKSAVVYSDHALMRHGRELWEITYAAEMPDEAVQDVIRSSVEEDGHGLWSDEVSLFSAKWAVHAFQRLMTSHTFAAALMCSDVQREVLCDIEPQWDAFMVVVPNGMLMAGGFEFSRVLVATYSFGAWLGLLAPDGVGFRLLTSDASSLPVLLASDEADLAEDSPSQRCVVLAKRLVAGLLLNLQDATAHKIRRVEARVKSKGREAEPEHRIVTIGAPLEIDCRGAVKEYIECGTRSSEKTGHRRHGVPTVQVMVRGHYRMQPHGPKHALRKKKWIRPFWRGPEAALIQTRAKVPSS